MSDILFLDDIFQFKNHIGHLTDSNHFVFKTSKKNGTEIVDTIILNIDTTELINQKNCYFVRLALDCDTDEYYLIFQREETGLVVTKSSFNNPRAQIKCERLCDFILDDLFLDYREPLEVSGNISNRPDMITIHLRGKHKHNELKTTTTK